MYLIEKVEIWKMKNFFYWLTFWVMLFIRKHKKVNLKDYMKRIQKKHS